MKKPKVIVIFPDKLKEPVGGLGTQFKELYKRLHKDIDFYIVGHPEKNDIPNYRGVAHPIPTIQHGSINTLIGHTAYFASAASFPKPDLIHAYDWTTYLAGYYLAKHFNVPLLVSMQLSAMGLNSQGIFICNEPHTVDGEWLNKTQLEIEKFGLHMADQIIHVSEQYSKNFSHPDLDKKSVVIPNGISIADFEQEDLPQVSLPGENPLKVVYIGRFAQQKSFSELLQAKIPSGIDLIIVGTDQAGADLSSLEHLKNKIFYSNNVFWLGPLYGKEKISVLNAADAVIFPSKHEPFGIVGLEALASKSILITSRKDGIADYANDSNSILIEDITPEGISEALYKFKNLDSKNKETLIFNGVETCYKFDWDTIATKYLEVYKNFI